MSTRALAVVLSLIAVFAPQVTISQPPPNIVVNGNFDTDVSGWAVIDPAPSGITGTLTLEHDPNSDSLGFPDSGALRLTWDLQDPSGTFEAFPALVSICFTPTVANTTYRPGSMYNWTQAPTGGAQLAMSSRNGTNCGSVVASLMMPFPFSDLNFWEARQATIPSGPLEGGVRMQLDILFVPDGMGASVSQGDLLVDRIFFREDPPLQPLQAVATLDSTATLTAFFLGEALDGASPFPVAYSWDFGDGGSSFDRNPAHTYLEAGIYTVTLTVDSGYEQATDTLTIQVDGATVQEIPTLSPVGFALLVGILAVFGSWVLRRRREGRMEA